MTLFPSFQVMGAGQDVAGLLTGRGNPQAEATGAADVVIATDSAIDAELLDAVRRGLGLVVLGADVDLSTAGIIGTPEPNNA
ncbi:MAG: hypothetical protein M3Y77_01855, partial [Actinomycetota bacterium]|nr:hypothetical protein [Actinomycetota bacterium]